MRLYQIENTNVYVNVIFKEETFWMTQRVMAELFGCTTDNISLSPKNLFRNGDKVEWPDGSNEKGFLSYKRCKNLWNLGARPSMNDNEAQELVEEIISCANTIPKNMLDDKSENIYVNAYFELVAYIKQQ